MMLIHESNVAFVIASPLCNASSTLQHLNQGRMGQHHVDIVLEQARVHLRFCMQIAKHQVSVGQYFLSEHPVGASS